MSIKELYGFLGADMARVETLIGTALGSDIALLDQTNRQLREHPGKMLRPMLSLLVAGAAGEKTEDSFRFAAAVELLHNATLLHDDVVDGAAQRRGLPTLYTLLGGGPAVLVGDYWLVSSLKLILSAKNRVQEALALFSGTLGHLTEGELLQMEKASRGDTTEADYLRIIYGKTASLFETAARVATLSVQAGETVTDAMGGYARLLGTAFQIKDDIFDYQEPSAALGKPVGIDLQEQKITQPLLCALETVSPEEAAAVRSKVARVADHPALAEEIRAFVRVHDGVALSEAVMDRYIDQAVACLDILPESEEKEYLATLARYIGDRNV